MTTDCKQSYFFTVGFEKVLCNTTIKLLSIIKDGMHSGNYQCKFNIKYPDGTNEDWVFQYPSARFHLYKGVAFQVISATSILAALEVSSSVSTPVVTPAPSGQKEYIFEFSGPLAGLSKTSITAINKIVQLLGGKNAYIEGNKIVVVM